ncbi:hypothetical protein PR048_024481 [Dryococelus australis]|uniref:Uncharacterized protein n=1 Tax=Dryococelus australis TaxID=614101 RepID=A0ABQ9GNQ4_9NEOP|nr:hypothetical protein PR048_024481 [Dryococelus australis]
MRRKTPTLQRMTGEYSVFTRWSISHAAGLDSNQQRSGLATRTWRRPYVDKECPRCGSSQIFKVTAPAPPLTSRDSAERSSKSPRGIPKGPATIALTGCRLTSSFTTVAIVASSSGLCCPTFPLRLAVGRTTFQGLRRVGRTTFQDPHPSSCRPSPQPVPRHLAFTRLLLPAPLGEDQRSATRALWRENGAECSPKLCSRRFVPTLNCFSANTTVINDVEKRGSVKDDIATRIKCPIAPKRIAPNWCAVFSSHCLTLFLDDAKGHLIFAQVEVQSHADMPAVFLRLLAVCIKFICVACLSVAEGRRNPICWSNLSRRVLDVLRLYCNFLASFYASRSPPTKANRVQSPVGSPDFRKWESCRTMPLVGGSFFFSGISRSPPPHPFHSGFASYSLQSPSSALETSLFRAAQISSLLCLRTAPELRFVVVAVALRFLDLALVGCVLVRSRKRHSKGLPHTITIRTKNETQLSLATLYVNIISTSGGPRVSSLRIGFRYSSQAGSIIVRCDAMRRAILAVSQLSDDCRRRTPCEMVLVHFQTSRM